MKGLKVKGGKLQTKINQKELCIAILKKDKVDFQARRVSRNQEGRFTRMKRLSQHNDITIIDL